MNRLLLILSILGLSACASESGLPQQEVLGRTVLIAPGTLLTLPQEPLFGRTLEVTQMVAAHYGEHTFPFEAHISLAPNHFLMVGLDMMGRKAMSIEWNAGQITYDHASWVPAQIRPENILADLVLLYAPAPVTRASLPPGCKLSDGRRVRTVICSKKRVWRAVYQPKIHNDPWSGSLSYRNLAYGYNFEVQSAESESAQ
jgi:hypothetical protein